MQHEAFMTEALNVAEAALAKGELPIGAVVVAGDRIVAASSTKERELGRLLVHAELLALESADQIRPYPGKRRDSVLYTTLEPCMMCLGACMSFNIGEIHFALESPGDGAVELIGKWERQTPDMPSYRAPKIHGGLLRRDSIGLFQRYCEMHQSGPFRDWAATLAAL